MQTLQFFAPEHILICNYFVMGLRIPLLNIELLFWWYLPTHRCNKPRKFKETSLNYTSRDISSRYWVTMSCGRSPVCWILKLVCNYRPVERFTRGKHIKFYMFLQGRKIKPADLIFRGKYKVATNSTVRKLLVQRYDQIVSF